MTARFAGRRALVTGASRGIGAAVAERLAAEGADVAVTARTLEARDDLPGSLSETAARLDRHGGRVGVVVADLTDETARAGIVARAVDALGGPLDILVNNAAAAIYGDASDLTLRRRRLMFEANVHAPLDLAQAALPAMLARGRGWIVNLSSRAARTWPGPPFELGPNGAAIALYGASKAALDRVTNGLGAELAGTGVRVNGVAPRAAVLTEGADALVGATLDPSKVESLEEMVEAVVALCACAEDVTGQTHVSLDLIADWGLTVRALDGTPR